MSNVLLEAETRTDMGKGASRRLRRLEGKIPAVLYGGSKKPVSITLLHKNVIKALETESIYSSVFDIKVDGKVEHVILKSLQRHPYKPFVLHVDLQRVSKKDVLVKMIPLHFINEDVCKGVKVGGMISHSMTQVEIRCQAQYLPEFIEVDMANVELDQVVHLSQLVLPKEVHLTIDVEDHSHDAPVVSVHMPRVEVVEEEVSEEEETEVQAAAEEKTAASESEAPSSEEPSKE